MNNSVNNQPHESRHPLFKPTVLSLAVAATISGHAWSQDQTEKQVQEIEEVEVIGRGYRKSIIDSIDSKRHATTIVEVVSAEDIGKLPDSSIAESIARLPGLAAQRLDGRASSISIRGLGENFSSTTFNGREQVSIGDNRGVEFDLYPSEIMAGVTVYKTSDASLTTQGIAGVIDLQTVRPLDHDERTIQINGSLEEANIGKLNPDGDDNGHRATLSYIDQFADGKVGVAVALATMESPNHEERWNAWGYPTNDNGDTVIGGAKPFVRSSMLDRDTFMSVLEFRPTDALSITADALYIDFLDEKILRGIEIPAQWSDANVVASEVVDGFVTEGSINGAEVVVRNDFEKREAELTAFGLNVEFNVNDNLTLTFDASHSEAERTVFSLESYSGTGRGTGVGATDNIGFSQNSTEGIMFDPQLDYSDTSLIELGGPLSWGNGSTVASDAQDGFINIPEIEDELDTLKLVANQAMDSGFITNIQAGLNYSDRSKSKKDSGIFLTLNNYPGTLAIPDEYSVGAVSLDFIGMGNMVAYDSFGLYQDGFYTETSENLTVDSRSINNWTVAEEVTTAFVKVDLETELSDMTLSGNLGMQAVQTDQESTGNAVQIVNNLVEIIRATDGDSYTDYLPSLNLTLKIDEQQQLRFAATRTLSRSEMDRLNAGFTYGVDLAQNVPGGVPFTASGGNPKLKPNTANQLDISYEHYFADDGYVSLAAYHKDLRNWQVTGNVPFDIADLVDPSTLPSTIVSTLGESSVWVSADGGEIDGYEISAAVPGHILSESLDGFGITASATFIDSSLQVNGVDQDVPGLSDEIFNFTFYYEKNGFQARTSMRKRSEFKGERFGTSFSREEVTVEGSELWDAQISYDFAESGIKSLQNMSVSLQAQNLTNEPYITYDDGGLIKDHQEFGRTYLLGASYKF